METDITVKFFDKLSHWAFVHSFKKILLLILTAFIFVFSVGIDIPDYISSGGKSDALKSLSERMKNFGRK